MQVADQKAIEKKKQLNKDMVAEVKKANDVALSKKQERIHAEKNEDLAIVQYEQEKRDRLDAVAAEEKRLKDEKEREV